jgi:hypothetical protein
MGAAEGSGPDGLRARPAEAAGIRCSDAAAIAWLALIPCALVAAGAILWLGPSLGRLLYPAGLARDVLQKDQAALSPEPVEDARYLISLIAPLLLALAIASLVRWRLRLPLHLATVGTVLAQLLGAAVVIACFIGQHEARWARAYFSVPTLAVAGLLAVGLALAARSSWVRGRALSSRDAARSARASFPIAATTLTAIWVLPALNSERSLHWFLSVTDVFFPLDELFAIVNGRTPLVNFSAQYGSLSRYLVAPFVVLFGKSVLAYTITMCAFTALVLLAVYGVMRRVAGSQAVAFLLYVPFVATSLFTVTDIASARFTYGTYFPMLPLRYGGPYVLAWLVARQMERARRTMSWSLLFAAAGLALLNNAEFGAPAFGATVAALLVDLLASRAHELRRLLASIALGLASAFAFVSALTLQRARALPNIGRELAFARLYAGVGYSVQRLPGLIGLPLVIYLTYVAAIAVAVVRAVNREPNRALTAMLAWSGVFGLGSATYYVVRSNFDILPAMFSAWALALALLGIVVLRHIAARSGPRHAIATFAVLFGLGLSACSLAQLPAPWRQIDRLQHRPAAVPFVPILLSAQVPRSATLRRFVSSIADGPHRFVVKPGAPVALFLITGHRIADAYGIDDVLPYTGGNSIHTREELDDALRVLRDAGGNTVILPTEETSAFGSLLLARGFDLLTRSGLVHALPEARPDAVVVAQLTKWVDMHDLHPAALR